MRTQSALIRTMAATLGVGHLGVAYVTWNYPPSYAAWAPVWAAIALFAGVTCLAAMFGDTRAMQVAGAAVGAHACSRAVAVAIYTTGVGSDPVRASWVVGAITWAMFGLVMFTTWHRSVVPWSAARGGKDDGG